MTSFTCPHCGYEIAIYTEALEAVVGGGVCLLCGSDLPLEDLEAAVAQWDDEAVVAEGAQRAEDEADYLSENEEIFEGTPDFGDEGEDEADPVL